MNEKELRALLAVQGKSLMVVWKKVGFYNLGHRYLTRPDPITTYTKTGWIAYTVPLAKKPKRDMQVEDDAIYERGAFKRHRKDAIRIFAKRCFRD